MATDLYANLSYEEYKKFEEALKAYHEKEGTDTAGEGRYYHKYFRLRIGDITLDVHGPAVKAG